MLGDGGWMGFGGGWMLILWILVIVVVVWLVQLTLGRPGGRAEGHSKTALELLEERYAKGEIDRDEFEQKKRDLLS